MDNLRFVLNWYKQWVLGNEHFRTWSDLRNNKTDKIFAVKALMKFWILGVATEIKKNYIVCLGITWVK